MLLCMPRETTETKGGINDTDVLFVWCFVLSFTVSYCYRSINICTKEENEEKHKSNVVNARKKKKDRKKK